MRWLKISFFGSSFVPNSSLKASCIIIISRFEESLSNPLHTLRMVRGSRLSLILLQSYCKFVFEACEMILYIKSLLQRRCFTLQFQFCRLSFHNIYNSSYRHSRLCLVILLIARQYFCQEAVIGEAQHNYWSRFRDCPTDVHVMRYHNHWSRYDELFHW